MATVSVFGAIILAVIAVIIYNLYLRPDSRSKGIASELIPEAELSKKPSIAVLPFENFSEDPEQAFFSDGLTEDLITGLSKINEILVIARNSTFAYKGKSVKIQKVAEELGVKYVLEGSVRRSEDQVRINAQLIDATTGSHIWAERYDGKMSDIFALQDQINDKIISALAVKLTAVEKQRLAHRETNNLAAYDAFLKGWEHYKRTTPDDFAKALAYFEESTKLDPIYARANAALALLYWRASMLGWYRRLHYAHFQQARFQARKYLALAMKDPTSISYQVSALISLFQRLHKQAITDADKALSLAPNDPYSHFIMAMILNYAGQYEKSTNYVERAMRLDPHYPADYVFLMGEIHFAMGKLEEAMTFFEKALERNPEVGGRGGRYPLIATYALLGRDQEAQAILEPLKRASTIFQVYLGRSMYYNPYKSPEVAARLAEGLIKAGVSTEHEAFSEYYTVSDEDRLDGDEIRSLVFGRTRTGLEGWLSGLQWWIECTQNGEGVYDGSEKGRHWVENDMLCHQWETSIWGIRWFEIPLRDVKYCGPVFRNPQGRPEKLNEYLEIPVWAIYPWSIEK
jgi:TolB-like protein/Tfp pilus assembly protein PilF